MVKKVLAIGVVVCSALMFPSSSEAGLADFIWGLSGPQMLGFGGGCRWTLEAKPKKDLCEVGASPTSVFLMQAPPEKSRVPVFFSVGGTFYTSTGTNGSQPYRWADVFMVAFEPGVSFRSVPKDSIQLYHGVGPTLDYVFPGRGDFDSFGKAGVKVTPVEVLFHRRIALALNLRYYPNRFTDDEFRPGPRLDIDRPSEWTWGFSVGILTKSK